ncbi:MAG TPA: hypothetical protein VEB21_04185, partial [Terriglobales bacterium]|nr:hypothetical protein [Terriglobales bacterium]
QGERLQELAARAVGELVSADMAQSWHRRLLEMAYFFDLTKRHAQAKAALAAALALEANGSGAGVPLCEALIRGSLTAHLQMTAEQEQEAARSSLIVTPGQAMRQAEQRRPR